MQRGGLVAGGLTGVAEAGLAVAAERDLAVVHREGRCHGRAVGERSVAVALRVDREVDGPEPSRGRDDGVW